MEFNKLVKTLLEGSFRAPVGTKRPVNAPNAANHGTVSPYISNKFSPAAYSGFKGDSLNPSTSTLSFRLPKKKIKKGSKKGDHLS